MKVETVGINQIKPYKNNPRDNDDAVDAVASSIKEFGWQQPIVVDQDNVIVAGDTRYKAAKKLHLTQVPVELAKHKDGTWLTEKECRAYRLADNKSGELATWNQNLLDEEMSKIKDIDMTDFGFEDLDNADLPDEFFQDTSGDLDDQKKEAPVKLDWGTNSVAISENDQELLDTKLSQFKADTGGSKSFVQFLLGN